MIIVPCLCVGQFQRHCWIFWGCFEVSCTWYPGSLEYNVWSIVPLIMRVSCSGISHFKFHQTHSGSAEFHGAAPTQLSHFIQVYCVKHLWLSNHLCHHSDMLALVCNYFRLKVLSEVLLTKFITDVHSASTVFPLRSIFSHTPGINQASWASPPTPHPHPTSVGISLCFFFVFPCWSNCLASVFIKAEQQM